MVDLNDIAKMVNSMDANVKIKYSGAYAQAMANSTIKGRDNWTYADWQEKDSKGLHGMMIHDPSRFVALMNAHYVG